MFVGDSFVLVSWGTYIPGAYILDFTDRLTHRETRVTPLDKPGSVLISFILSLGERPNF